MPLRANLAGIYAGIPPPFSAPLVGILASHPSMPQTNASGAHQDAWYTWPLAVMLAF